MSLRAFAILLAAMSSLLFSGCATQGMQATPVAIEKTRVLDAPFDTVWPVIIGQIAESNLKITTLEKASGLIAINDVGYSPADAYEGVRGALFGIPEVVILRSASFNIFATNEANNKTKVRVNASMKMQIRSGNGSQMFPFLYRWENAYSNGRIEKFVLDGVESHLIKQ